VGIYWVDPEHPITRDLSNFDWKDEIYYDMDLAPGIQVLATSFHNVHIIAPQVWTFERTTPAGSKPYRAVVSLPGHEYDVFNTPQYRTVLMRSIAWAGRHQNVDAFTSPEELASLRYPPGGPLPARESIKTFQLHPEFEVALTADEQVAQNIMSLDWDPQGRLWVVETPEYPGGRTIHRNDAPISPWRAGAPDRYPVGGKEPRPARDRVSILESTRGDGVMDRKTVFADGLELPTSLVFYRDGVIVSQAPHTLWLRDTDGDGKADRTELLFTGWGTMDTHATTSNLRWGPNGWIYGSVGYSAGDITSGDGSKSFGRITAGLYRFRPDGSALEQVAAGSCNTWGCEVAPDGEIFFSTATCGEPILHVVMPEQVLSRAGVPGVRAANPIMEENKVFPARTETRQPYVQIDWVGAWTAASGATIYDGGAWPSRWRGPEWSFFVHEPTVWLMHHEFLDPVGVSYQGRRENGRARTHFLTSTDYWFKPIHSRVGPDGALYLVDFYNQIAVHNDTRGPAHGAHNAATRPDRDHKFTRIYRIQHREAEDLPEFRLAAKDPTTLIAMLDHPNGWVRMTANRLLSEGAGLNALDTLAAKATSADTAFGRMQALWVLHNLDQLSTGLIESAADDHDPVIRKNALWIVAERTDAPNQLPLNSVTARLNDPEPRVRLAALLAATRYVPERQLADAVAGGWVSWDDPHLRAAALAVAAADPVLFLEAAFASGSADRAGLVAELTRLVAQRNDAEEVAAVLLLIAGQPASGSSLQVAALHALASHTRRDVRPVGDAATEQALARLLGSEATAGAALPLVVRWGYAGRVAEAVQAAVANEKASLADASLADDARAQVAINLLGVRELDGGIISAVAGLIAADISDALRERIIEALGAVPDAAAGEALLVVLPGLGFDLREIAFGQLLKRADWSAAVVTALADKKLDYRDLGPANLYRLRTHPDAAVAGRAATVIEALQGPAREEKAALIDGLVAEVIRPGNAAKGAEVFTQNCAPCHQFKDEGADFAPSLTGMGAHGPEELLVHILDPNRVVEPNYYAVSVETRDDFSYDGIVLRENRSMLVLRNQTAETTLRKDDIVSRRTTNRSLMPDGFEALGAEALRDLLTFICQDDQRFRIIDLSDAFTADSTRGIYISTESRDESLRFRKWGTIQHRGVPFDIVNPQRTPNGKNLVVLRGGHGFARAYPREVEVNVGLPVTRLHVLGGVGGWAFPGGVHGAATAVIKVHYADGGTEDIVLRNGVEIADYIAHIDVPGSEPIENMEDLLLQGRQLRYLSRPLTGQGVVQKLTFTSDAGSVAPTFVAVTAELGDAPMPTAARVISSNEPDAGGGWGDGLKTLIIGGGASHDYDRWFNQEDVGTLNAAPGISAQYTDRTEGLADLIAQVDVLIVSNNKPFTDDATKQAITRHVQQGKGFIGLHPGLWYNWKDWPEYNRDLIGGGSRGHDRLEEFEVVATRADHPLLKDVPSKFSIVDELYWFEPDPAGPAIDVLASAYSKQKQKDYPQVFTVAYPGGRVVGITLGHDGRAHQHRAYIQLLRNAVLWAGGRTP
jgi:putative membrane-bound dehydrogenase-like protein